MSLSRPVPSLWINHTWSHTYLGCQVYVAPGDATSGCATWMSATAIADEIAQNQTSGAEEQPAQLQEVRARHG